MTTDKTPDTDDPVAYRIVSDGRTSEPMTAAEANAVGDHLLANRIGFFIGRTRPPGYIVRMVSDPRDYDLDTPEAVAFRAEVAASPRIQIRPPDDLAKAQAVALEAFGDRAVVSVVKQYQRHNGEWIGRPIVALGVMNLDGTDWREVVRAESWAQALAMTPRPPGSKLN